ncbi:MAG: hypothetical protein U1F27_09730 [Turneriella sp.]
MARNTSRQARVKPETTGQLSVADTLFAIATKKYPNAAAEFLTTDSAKERAIREFQRANAAKLAALSPATVMPEAKRGNVIRVAFRAVTESRQMKYLSRAALLLVAFGAGLTLLNFFGDDSIRIVDELGKSALNAEFGGNDNPVSLKVMRKRKKIGEITVGQGSKLRVVKTSNGESFRSEMAFAGNEADFKLKYKGKASVIVNNGPFKAKVRIAQGPDNDVHLRFKELGSPLPVGEPKFAIEVIKGDVQIAEVDDGDDFEQYKAGEKAIFTLSPSDTESL